MSPDYLSTRQIAEKLNVSESSVKRWCDAGVLPSIRTAGGHRRVPRASFMKYLEQKQLSVVENAETNAGFKSEAAGGPTQSELKSKFVTALALGDEQQARYAIGEQLARCNSIANLADVLIAPAFQELGEQWCNATIDVYQERLATGICLRLLHEIRNQLPAPGPDAPLAIGAAPESDPYEIATQLIELVLRQNKWQSVSLGCNIPFKSIDKAVKDRQPDLLWLSISCIEDTSKFLEKYAAFQTELPRDVCVVLGGRALTDALRPKLRYSSYCDNMRQLESLASVIRHRRSG